MFCIPNLPKCFCKCVICVVVFVLVSGFITVTVLGAMGKLDGKKSDPIVIDRPILDGI